MKHLGDILNINGAEIPKVDCITFGAPCQDLSVAGGRKGMTHTDRGDEETSRSGLFFEAVRVIKEMRDDDKRNGNTGLEIRPRYAVYENVPGAFSSNKGKDWQAVLTEIVRIVKPDAPDVPIPPKGKWGKSGCLMGYGDDGQSFSVAWRVHDAQFWGVAQRRKRVSLVADFGGISASEILFERKGVSGDPEQSAEKGKGASTGTEGSTGKSGIRQPESISFQERSGKPGGGKGILIQNEHTGALSTLNNQSVFSTAYGICSYESNSMKSPNPHSGIYKADTARTLDLNGGSPACNQGVAVVNHSQIGGGHRTVGSLCARDYKGIGNQYVDEGKCIIESGVNREPPE